MAEPTHIDDGSGKLVLVGAFPAGSPESDRTEAWLCEQSREAGAQPELSLLAEGAKLSFCHLRPRQKLPRAARGHVNRPLHRKNGQIAGSRASNNSAVAMSEGAL